MPIYPSYFKLHVRWLHLGLYPNGWVYIGNLNTFPKATLLAMKYEILIFLAVNVTKCIFQAIVEHEGPARAFRDSLASD
ncbi:hypothetical protein OI69_11425 [Pectobacterium fontis]|uniref:Uncharacterized protein n=1 Tax=Pectobacterium fontis TaxID=2558042 RepID=A0A7V8II45_9GAMM|nr:hypothetical protein OI69_11425 [Pectobacterium fontis]